MNDQPRRRPAQQPKPHRRPKKDPVRILAFEALRAVDERDAYANLVLPPLLKKARDKGDFDARDAALATELVYGTLRRQGTYDAIIAACVDRPLREVDPPVLDVLALGAHQLLGTRIPTHAAVSASVELARVVLGDGRAKFVNAVLRKVSADDLDGWLERVAPPYDDDAEENLAIVHSHPRWIVSALWDSLGGGRAGIEDLLEADNERPEVTLVARPGRSTPDELLDTLGEDSALPGRWSPYAVRLAEGASPARSRRYGTGAPASRTRAASSSRSPWPTRRSRAATSAGSTAARAPAARPPCWRRSPHSAARRCSPRRSSPTGRVSSSGRWQAIRARTRSSRPTGPGRRGCPGPSTGC